MKTSLKKRIISIAAAAVMTLSMATVGMASASAATVDNTQTVGAYNQNITIRVNLPKEWKRYDASFAAYFFNEVTGEYTWAKINTGYRGYYYASVSGDYTHVIFVRFPAGAEYRWENACDATANLRISDLNNPFIPGWELDAQA